MRIAVTGATGMIGTGVVRGALDLGHEVIAIVRADSPRLANLPKDDRITVVNSDITGYKGIEGVEKCNLFIHLAWKETFGAARDNTFLQVDNIKYALDAVNLAHSWGAEAFLGVGSQAEYGLSNQMLSSSSPTDPESGYGVAKYAAGKMCKLLCDQYGMRFNWGRITSTYGELDQERTLIMYLINTLLDGKSPELTKCEQIWDYTYVKDMAQALLAIAINGVSGKTYAIGSGEHRMLRDYVISLRDHIDPDIEIKFGAKPYYDHQPMLLCPDISELSAETGYRPKYSFDEGIVRVIEYVRSKRGN